MSQSSVKTGEISKDFESILSLRLSKKRRGDRSKNPGKQATSGGASRATGVFTPNMG